MDSDALLRFARDAAEEAGGIALGHFQRAPRAWHKADGTWVTEADHAAEAALRARIAAAYPAHNVLGEEEGLRAADGGPAVAGAPTWIVDPIDGTANFVDGIPIWATLVALRVADESVVGVAHAPALGETYAAARGGGATLNDAPITCSPLDRLEAATVLYGADRGFSGPELDGLYRELGARVRRLRGFGDFWGHMLVARGSVGAMVEAHSGLSVWDVAALEPIVAEAGGRMLRFDGRPFVLGQPVLTVSAALADAVVELTRASVPA